MEKLARGFSLLQVIVSDAKLSKADRVAAEEAFELIAKELNDKYTPKEVKEEKTEVLPN